MHAHGLAAILGSLLCLLGSGCSAGYESKDPVSEVKNKDLQLNQREIALDQLWKDVQEGKVDPKAGRESLKDLIWKGGAPTPLRQKALALLLSDTTPDAMADTRNLLRLRLPTETSWPMIVTICKDIEDRAADPAWQDQTASLIRSYARKVPDPPDADRPERAALLALHPGKPIDDIAVDVFVRTAENGAPANPDDAAQKSANAAWDLLGRLDPDGSKRAATIAERAGSEPALAQIGRAARELGVVPVTGSELTWLRRMLGDKDPRAAQWWSETSAAVQQLSPDQRQGLQIRHLEPIRWAAAHRSEWLGSRRVQLMAELTQHLRARTIHRKSGDAESGTGGETSKETVRDWESALAYGDVLAILVLDEAVHQPAVIADLFKQADADLADTTTECGGVIWSTDEHPSARTAEPFLARAYPPRPTQRANDRTFIAPEEMFADSARSLAHYHFHVQTWSNAEYAGPGKGDLDYAVNHGRSCLVFTAVKEGILDVDYYQRNGAIIDLGEIHRAR